jgi:hypothetical protein
MSLKTSDNYFGTEHVVNETHSSSYIDNGVEHEIVLSLAISYKSNGELFNIETDHWAHYTYDNKTGMNCHARGRFSDDMDSDTYVVFNKCVREIKGR